MKALFDTHVLLWALTDDPRLPHGAREVVLSARNELWYSVASIWEVEIKHLAHPEEMTMSGKRLSQLCHDGGARCLAIRESHIHELGDLSRPTTAPRHKDPFDRLLIAQAKAEGLTLITHDHLLADYREPCIITV